MSISECSSIQRLMSPFIDSMATALEAERLQGQRDTADEAGRLLAAHAYALGR